MRIEVDSAGWTSAVDEFYGANRGVVDAVTRLSGALGGSGSMAGSDSGGEEWARQYDEAAGPLLEAGGQLGGVLAQLANLSNASLSNHQGADYGSRVYGPPVGESAPDDPDPGHSAETVSVATPPSAYGGTGDQPGWWHWISGHIGGLLWPDADTGQLRSTGDAWRSAGQALSLQTSAVSGAAAQIGMQRSPEVADAVATCTEVQGHLDDLGSAYTAIGQACSDYAQQVDEHHQMIEDELTSFIEWTIGIEAGGAILGAVTFGIGEAAAQAAEAAKVAEAATKVISILQKLIEVARLAALRVGEVVTKVAGILERLKAILSAKVAKALEKVAPALAKDAKFLEDIPAWADGGAVPTTGPAAELYAGGVERYGGLTREEFMTKYWDAEKGGWRYPPRDGFAGDPAPNTLSEGDVIDRLGGPNGSFASPRGSAYGDRALAPNSIGRDYHQYEVLKALPDSVTEGKVAPWFEQAGGGVQYQFDHNVQWYIDHGFLKEVP